MLENTWCKTDYHLDILQAKVVFTSKLYESFKHSKMFLGISCTVFYACSTVKKFLNLIQTQPLFSPERPEQSVANEWLCLC
jgi:hypothetical protein